MRMRKKKHGAERIDACSSLLIADPALMQAGFESIFPVARPVHMEIGCGKGNFACGMAKLHPEVNFVAVERVADVCCIALEKAMACRTDADNLRFFIGNASTLAESLPPHSLDCIYLNFSDPWPKKGHAKRRLTHRGFLLMYKELLRPGGIIKLKTDNVGLFDFSLEEFAALDMEVLMLTRDLHNSELAQQNVMTEYEKNFSQKGYDICSAWVRFKS